MFIAFPLQQWLHDRATVSRCTYVACFVKEFLVLEQQGIVVYTSVSSEAGWFLRSIVYSNNAHSEDDLKKQSCKM